MRRQRPILTLPLSTQARVLNLVSIVGLVAILVMTIHAWAVLPERIPVHFGVDGRPNGWGSKSILGLFPVMAALNYGLLTLLRRYPHRFNYAVPITEQNALRQYEIACAMLDWMKTELVWLFVYIVWQLLQLTTHEDVGLGLLFLSVVIFVIPGTTGYWLYQSHAAR